jgi:arylsulfatase A-like enzyme
MVSGLRLALLLLALAGCQRAQSDGRPSVLLVTVDTLRADRVGCYGQARELTPNLDRLAAEGVRFERAYTHAPFTAPAHASLLTSLLTPSHGVLAWAEKLTPEARTLGERFAAAGYRTAAFYNNPGLEHSGMTRGFETVRRFYFETADTTVDAFLDWLDSSGNGAFCAWVHLWDVHRPYAWRDWRQEWLRDKVGRRKPPFLAYGEELFGDPPSVEVGRHEGFYNLNPEKRATPQQVGKEKRLLDAADIAYVRERYDAGVLFADRGLGRLFSELQERGLYERALIAVTSDHGESLTEREACYFSHDPFLYEETLRVPLVIRFPDRRYAGRVVTSLARGIDLLPTLCEVAGLAPEARDQGASLVGRIEGRDPAAYFLHAQTQTRDAKERRARAEDGAWLEHRVAFSDGRHKLIHDLETGRSAYFDLESDPLELRDRIDDPTAAVEVERLEQAYRELESALPRAGETTAELGADALDALEGMGYVESERGE